MSNFASDLVERVVVTYVEVFLGLLIASGFGVDGVTSLDTVEKAALAAIPAVLVVLKGLIAKKFGNPDSASLTADV